MPKKEVTQILFLIVCILTAATLIMTAGCGKKDNQDVECNPPLSIINNTCCEDFDNDSVCDENASTPATVLDMLDLPPEEQPYNMTCGDDICDEQGENCTNCWQDCGACKKIVYIYVPRNFTLGELTYDLNEIYRDGIRFRKDITALNNVSNFFYFEDSLPRYYADFLGHQFRSLDKSRKLLLNHIFLENYYVNDSASLLNYVNFSNWYLTYRIRNDELTWYENRISADRATEDYPTQPTGYQKKNRYEDWSFENFTKKENLIFENVTILENSMVESIYAGYTDYDVTYKYNEYFESDEPEFRVPAYKTVEERRLALTHSVSFICSRNLVITVYNYYFDPDQFGWINEDNIRTQVGKNRQSLIKEAHKLKYNCDKKYRKEVFIYE